MKQKTIGICIIPAVIIALIPLSPSLGLAPPTPLNHELELSNTSTIEQVRADAQALAGQYLDAAFRTNPHQNIVTIGISVSFNGESVPFLSITLDRATWNQKTDRSSHIRYFTTAINFLHRAKSSNVRPSVRSTPVITRTNSTSPPVTNLTTPNRYPNLPPPDRAKIEADLKQLRFQERGY